MKEFFKGMSEFLNESKISQKDVDLWLKHNLQDFYYKKDKDYDWDLLYQTIANDFECDVDDIDQLVNKSKETIIKK